MQTNKNIKNYVRFLPVYGCISTGFIYLGIGVVAILSLLKLKDGGADESSLLAYLNDYTLGKILVWIILLGTLSYIFWRIYEAITDPYGYGAEFSGLTKRTGIALSTIADILIAFSAIQILTGTGHIQAGGEPEEQRQMVQTILQESWGSVLVITIGVIIFITAILQFQYGVTRGYKERLDIAEFSADVKRLIHFLGWTGYLARGIIVGIIGFFFIKAGISKNAQYVVNTDKAFDFIGDHVGLFYFVLVAIGTLCYSFFIFFLGITYDADKD